MTSPILSGSAFIALMFSTSATFADDKQLLWGDTHVHTAYSPDAYLSQNFSAEPETAYRFAMGLPVIHPSTRTRVQIETPLDFLVVADHAESMGVFKAAAEGNIPKEEMEVTQVKGDSERDSSVSPNDPFADFESFPYYLKPGVGDYKPEKGDFILSGLLTGLALTPQDQTSRVG
jgi:hypothetical protein